MKIQSNQVLIPGLEEGVSYLKALTGLLGVSHVILNPIFNDGVFVRLDRVAYSLSVLLGLTGWKFTPEGSETLGGTFYSTVKWTSALFCSPDLVTAFKMNSPSLICQRNS